MTASPRTYLYVPGDRPERFDKAAGSGADAVVLDLEDAVAGPAKAEARDAIVRFLAKRSSVPLWVRINLGAIGEEDLEAIGRAPGLAGLFVPKARLARLADVHERCPGLPLCALIETAEGLSDVRAIASSTGVELLAMGEVDLAADLRMGPAPTPAAMWPLRAQVVVAAAGAGLDPPIGPVHLDLGDDAGLRRSTKDLLAAGFWSRQVIHPAQISLVHGALAPSPAELERAQSLLDSAERTADGVWLDDDGRMVDEAVLRSARDLLGGHAPGRRADPASTASVSG